MFRTRLHPGGLAFTLLLAFVTISSNSEHRASRSSPLELHFPIPCLPITKGHLSLSFPILALKSPTSRSLSVRGMPLSTLARWLLKASFFSSGFVIVGAYTLIIVAKLFLLRGSLIVMILSLTGRGISVSFVVLSFLIAKPTPAALLSPYSRGARVQILEVVDTSCYFWLSCILLNVKPSRTIFQRATFSNQCTSLRKLRLYPCP